MKTNCGSSPESITEPTIDSKVGVEKLVIPKIAEIKKEFKEKFGYQYFGTDWYKTFQKDILNYFEEKLSNFSE